MKVYGLTGSIGMGKSTVAAMFRRAGVPVFDADAEVHRLQGPDGPLLPAIEARFPGTTGLKGVNRARLGAAVFGDPQARKALEAIVHPAVHDRRKRFLKRHRARAFVILDIPLLFETRGERRLNGVIVVTAPAWKQRRRVLARPGMTASKFRQIVNLQTPDAVKRTQADYIINTGTSLAETAAQVRRLVACLGRQTGR